MLFATLWVYLHMTEIPVAITTVSMYSCLKNKFPPQLWRKFTPAASTVLFVFDLVQYFQNLGHGYLPKVALIVFLLICFHYKK